MNAQSVAHFVIILFIILGNIGYFIEKRNNSSTIFYKSANEIAKLTDENNQSYFENSVVKATFNKAEFKLNEGVFKSHYIKEYKFRKAAEMSILLEGASELYE